MHGRLGEALLGLACIAVGLVLAAVASRRLWWRKGPPVVGQRLGAGARRKEG